MNTSIMMNEFMQVWTDDQDHSPLEHHSQKQRDNLDSDASGGIRPSSSLFGLLLSVHETLQKGNKKPRCNLSVRLLLQDNCNKPNQLFGYCLTAAVYRWTHNNRNHPG
jgi:hypothetical protein